MNYEVAGHGPPVLLVHGFPLDRRLWAAQVDALAEDYRVITPDLRGFGESEAPTGPYTMDLLAEDMRALLRELGIEQVILVGLSMGGYVSFAFWRLYPNVVRALVLADTRAAPDTPEGKQNRQDMIQRVQSEGVEPIAEEMLSNVLSNVTLADNADAVQQARRMMTGASVEGIVGALQGMIERPDSRPTLPSIAVPTLIVVGEDDTLTPPSEAEAMRDAILGEGRGGTATRRVPEVRVVRIPGAGHLSPLENPGAFNQALREFLDEVTE
jgi:pimeloyl-ACP methyl ester carboxylesterase